MINDIFVHLLLFFADIFNGDFGLAIIAVTLIIRMLLLPIILPSARSQRKMMALQPELNKLKKKYRHDKQLLTQKQMELYKNENINPLGGCLPQIVQLGLFIVFYRVLNHSLIDNSLSAESLRFFWLDLSQPDNTYIMSILTGASQFLLGLMLIPAADNSAELELAAKTKTKKDDKEAFDSGEMAKTMQQQMVFIMPIMTAFLALRFPSGLALYWLTSTLFSLVQQYFVSGLGGLEQYMQKFGIIKNSR